MQNDPPPARHSSRAVVDAVSRPTKRIPVPHGFAAAGPLVDFEIVDDAMSGDGVLYGDVLTCSLCFGAEPDVSERIVVIRLAPTGELLARRIVVSGRFVSLIASNPDWPLRRFPRSDVRILAVAVELRRPLF